MLSFIANPERGSNKTGRLQRLIKLQRLMLEQNPSPQIYKEIADTLRRMDQNAEAAATIQQMIEKYPNERTGRSLGVLAELERRAGHTKAALAAASQAVQLDANDVEIQVMLADLLGDTGKIDQALEILNKVIKNEPDNARYKFMLGGMLTKFGRNDEAVKVFQDLIKRFASNDEVVKLAHSSLSIIYVNQGDYAKGEAELEILFQKTPDDPGVNNDLGYLYADQGKNLEKAESMIRKAVQEEPDKPAYLDSLGWVLFKRGKAKESLEPLLKAVELQKLEEKKGMRLRTRPFANILATSISTSRRLTEPGRSGRKPSRSPPRPFPPTSGCRKFARSSHRSKPWAPCPRRHRTGLPERIEERVRRPPVHCQGRNLSRSFDRDGRTFPFGQHCPSQGPC